MNLINTEAGRYLLGIKNNYPIVKVTPSSYIQQLDKETFKGVFFSYDKVDEIFQPIISKIKISNEEYKPVDDYYKAFLHFSGLEKSNKYPQIYLTAYSAVAAGSGRIVASNAVWATARAATTGTLTGTDSYVGAEFTASTYYIYRAFTSHNTASIPDAASISAADITATPTDVNDADNDGNDFITVVQSTQADATNLVAGDFDQVGSTEAIDSGQRKDLTGLSGEQTFTFNATGRGYVSKTGHSTFALRGGHDLNNSAVGAGQTYCTWGNDAMTLNVTFSVAGGYIFIQS